MNPLDINSITTISNIFQIKPEVNGNHFKWILESTKLQTSIFVNLFLDIKSNSSPLISVQTTFGYYELHNIIYWEELSYNEIIFFSDTDDYASAMFVSKDRIAIYSNVDKKTLKSEIIGLDSKLLLYKNKQKD